MAVKRAPKWINVDSLTDLWKSRVEKVTEYVNRRGDEPTSIGNVSHSLGFTYAIAWQSLDKAWNCGLICKVVKGNSCHWQASGDGPVVVY